MSVIWRDGVTKETQYAEVNGVQYRLVYRPKPGVRWGDWLVFEVGKDEPPILGAYSERQVKQLFEDMFSDGPSDADWLDFQSRG